MKFRKKPVVIDAVQFTEEMILDEQPLPKGVVMKSKSVGPGRKVWSHRHVIETLEGEMQVNVGDWIITGVNGERYPCKPDIFEKTYDAVS